MDLVTPDALAAAVARLDGHAVRTPLLECSRLSDEFGARILLKPENLQHTGSFKFRGALNALLNRSASGALPKGISTFSAGNHAAATAFAARLVGIPAVVCMPHGAVPAKVDAVRRYGGEIIFTDDLIGAAESVAVERGYEQLHPFDDPDVIAGQGTVGVEIFADCAPDLVVVPVGGGGLISGVSVAARAGGGRTPIVGVEPRTANAMSHALRTGSVTPPPVRPSSLADGLAAPIAGVRTLAHVRAYADEIVEIDEEQIAEAWWDMLDATKLFVEPAAAVGLAALRAGGIPIRSGSTVVLILSGGNASRTRVAEMAARV